MGYPISLLVIAAINFGALGRYVPHLKTDPMQVMYPGAIMLVPGTVKSYLEKRKIN